MSLPQEQKDTIREEFRNMWDILEYEVCTRCKSMNTHRVSDYVLAEPDDIEEFWLNKLDQAYQQGAKDKVEEVRGDIWKKIVELAEPDERQFGGGNLNTHLDFIYDIIFKR